MNQKRKRTRKTKIIPSNYTAKQLENEFMSKLLEYSRADLSNYYSRRKKFLSGKSINYCKIGRLKFKVYPVVKELKLPPTAFRLGLEFGINISIDVFSSLMMQLYENAGSGTEAGNKSAEIKKTLLRQLGRIR